MNRIKHKEKKPKVDDNMIRIKLTSIFCIIIFLLSMFLMAGAGTVSGAWKYNDFEDNIAIDFRPKTPKNNEPVNITILGKSQQEIKGANIYYNYSVFGVVRSGGAVFKPIPENPYALFVVIPGYPGSTVVSFTVEAWDLQHVVITSTPHTYIVEKNNSWKYTEFYQNLELVYDPVSPGPNDPVNITVRSRDKEVGLANVEVYFNLKPKDLDDYGQADYAPQVSQIDSVTWFSQIRSYPEGTAISFWVVAYDAYNTAMTSNRINYTVKKFDPDVIFVKTQLWIQVADKTGEKLEPADVFIQNETWSASFKTDENGLLLTPELYNGDYTITVSYLTYLESKEVKVSIDLEQTTVTFTLDKAQILSEQHGMEDFPKWYIWAAFIFVLILLPLMFLRLQEQKRESLTKKRAEKIYRKAEAEMNSDHAPSVFDPFIAPLKPILKLIDDEPKRIGISQFIAFFFIGLAGTTWAPFYPWWLIIILGFAIGSISYRFPYLALIVLSLFVMAAAAYQAPEFGFAFLTFSLVILIAAFFSWKFGYLVFLAVFISRLGIMVFVPITAALLYSVFMGIAVVVVSGLFLSFFVTCGNLTNLGFLIGPPHKSAFIIFNKSPPSEFLPVHFVDALGSLDSPNLELMNNIFRSNYNSMVPIIQIVIWAVIIYFIYFLTDKYYKKNFKQYTAFIIVPLAFLPITALSSLAYFEHDLSASVVVLSIALIGIGLTAVMTTFSIKELYPSLFKREIERDIIGTRISQLMTLRKTSFKTIGGLTEVKRELKTAITVPLLKPKLSRIYGVNPPKGVLLFGPPGCGKTMIMRALATELNVEMIGVKCSDIMSKWYGESEEMTARMFEVARQRKPCILFLDEVDAIAKRRSYYSTDDVTPRLLSIMLNELDGMDESAGIMVVGATNMPELIDPALMRPGRFDKIIFIPPPDFEARMDIFKIYLKEKPLEPGVNYYELAGKTEGYTGADIENIVKEASMRAMRRTMEQRRRSYITMEDFNKILREIKPSVSRQMAKDFEKLGFDYSRRTEAKKKKKTKKSRREERYENEEEEEDRSVIEMDDGEISWEEEEVSEEEVEEVEPPSWDKFKSKEDRGKKKKEKEKEEVTFSPVEDEEGEGEEEAESWDEAREKGSYGKIYKGEEDPDDYWM